MNFEVLNFPVCQCVAHLKRCRTGVALSILAVARLCSYHDWGRELRYFSGT